tara:strand:- start:2584 stop:3291 length:708 start_codon:yes stop_codon:yes gene_type:complete
MALIPLFDKNPTKKLPVINYTIIMVCIIVFIIQTKLNYHQNELFIIQFGMIPSVLIGVSELSSEIRVFPSFFSSISYIFLHGSWLHLLGNMGYLYIFGDNIEDYLGKSKYILFFLLCGCIAGFSQAIIDINSNIPMIGASGSVFGVLGAYFILFPRAKIKVLLFFLIPINISSMYLIGGYVFLQFLLLDTNSSNGGVAYMAHIGGFFCGLIFIKLLKKKFIKNKKLNKGTLPSSR